MTITNVISVTKSGIIAAYKNGTATITASTLDGSLSCECTVAVVTSVVKLSTISTTGEKIATGFTPGDKAADMIADISSSYGVDAANISIKDAAGNDAGQMATGQTLTVDGIEYVVVIYGDTNGDGVIKSNDVQVILDYVTGASHSLDDNRACFLAADVLKTGSVTIESALFLQRSIYELETLSQN